jgi:hypothetical protein
MSRQDIAAILGRAAIDKQFLGDLRANPEEALSKAGIEVTEAEMGGLKRLNFDALEQFNSSLTHDLAAIHDSKGI